MVNRVFSFFVPILIYFSIIGIIVPFLVIEFRFYLSVYTLFEEWASRGFFFSIYLISTFFFFPFIYSTLVKERLSFNINIKKRDKKRMNPRQFGIILFVIGIPLMIWFLLGLVGYYSITEVNGGLGQLVQNGFLVLLIVLMYFCIFPAIILSLKKNKF
ncbi:hypothetical protein LCGC14_0827760 [marine sediment metagenome]|uniref:Uncharacterized protein n=1 Tax=marine sediment metagenome TaxID=412755 RepID=A0A0F9SP93_9ZZZZ|nr:MAG: hypothetical protein Lokiarch_38580 [Candidatus Lokiarchaeum sp. GC14_75]